MERLTTRGLVEEGRLTRYGREVEAMPVDRAWAELLVHADPELVPIVAVCSNIDSLHRMTREERELHGALVNGSDHLTAYNLFAEAVNQCGTIGEVYGLPRHTFVEEELAAWAERRGVLVKAIEDTALGTASVYRAIEQPLPRTLPHASKEIRRKWIELLARVMPFDLVIDEHTADGQEARISKTSVAGSWGAVAGNLRFFADRFGAPRAGIEGTTIPYDTVREYATWGKPTVSVTGPRKHQHLATHRRLDYFGFHLETVTEEIEGDIPASLLPAARDALVSALLGGESAHPDQGRIRRAVADLDEMWRRSGGTLEAIAPPAVRALLRAQVESVVSWAGFLRQRVVLEPEALVPADRREALAALPTSVRLHGDAAPLHYEVEDGAGIVRLFLREGQARRFQERDLPPLDRPLRFGILRAGQGPALGATVAEAMRALQRRGDGDERRRDEHGGGRGGKGGPGRGGPGGKGHRRERDSQHWRKRR
jgi:hypothetical protein